jgi:hypothetical protein
MIFVRLARREPGGAKGLLESMAAGNKQWYRPLMMKGKGKVNIVLHRSNEEAICGQPIPSCIGPRGPAHNLPQTQAPARPRQNYSTVTEMFTVRVMLPLTAVTTTVKLPVGETGTE